MDQYLSDWRIWAWAGGTIAVAIAAGLIAHGVIYFFARRWTERHKGTFQKLLVKHTQGPARLILPLAGVFIVSPGLGLRPGLLEEFRHLLSLALIGAMWWLALKLIQVVDDLVAAKYTIEVEDNYRARSVRTQVVLLHRVLVGVISLAGVAAILMTFPSIWHLGAGLFASAGVAGLVAGMAARPALANLIAGVQVALTEPIRIDDVIIVEGEYGRVEEVNTTYVVVRIWDLRRMVVPLTYFIEKPFQNWTRRTANLLGTVMVYADYMVDIDALRTELESVVKASKLWDGKVWNLQVTDTKDNMLELRCMVSAIDSPTLWDLRVEVREKMIKFLQRHYPGSLPRMRADIVGGEMRMLTQPEAVGAGPV